MQRKGLIDPKILKARFHPDLVDYLPRDELIIEAIAENMRLNGYDHNQPALIANIKEAGCFVCDSHTRTLAAIKAGIIRMPYDVKDFDSIDDVKKYMNERQDNRRNYSEAQYIIRLKNDKILNDPNYRDENGKKINRKKYVAKLLNKSERTASNYLSILSDPKYMDDILSEKITVSGAIKKKAASKKTDVTAAVKKVDIVIQGLSLSDRIKVYEEIKKRARQELKQLRQAKK